MNQLAFVRPAHPVRVPPRALSLLVFAAMSACTALPGMDSADTRTGQDLIAQGRVSEGLEKMRAAAAANPRQPDAYDSYIVRRDEFVSSWLRSADAARAGGDQDTAEKDYGQALRLDPASVQAKRGIDAVELARRLQRQSAAAEEALQAGDVDSADRMARAVLAEDPEQPKALSVARSAADQRAQKSPGEPQLKAALQRRISLELRDVPLQTAFEVISKTANINFVLDRDVKADQRTTIFVRDTNLDDVIKILMVTNQLDRKILNGNSIVIYPNTPAKQHDYQDQIMRSFFLANADVKQTATMIRSLVKTKDIFVDEKLNLLIMRDTPEAVRLAEQLVATQDLGEPEVVLDLEVLEVASSLVQNFGLQYPTQVVANLPTVNSILGSDGTTSLAPLSAHGLRAYVANPALILNISRSDSGTTILANPRIRVKNHEKAKVLIGEKVPVITTTSTANVGVSSSVNYIDTGLKLDVEPTIYLENDVGIKVSLEVSTILSQLNISNTIAYTLGTRNAETTLRLKDGETQMLAGLINNTDTKAAAKVPLLSDFPLLGRLFRNDNDSTARTEVVLLITPHVVRNLVRPATVGSRIDYGTEAAPGVPSLRLSSDSSRPFTIAAMPAAGTTAPMTGADGGSAPTLVAQTVALLVQAPAQVPVGQDFVLNLSAPGAASDADATVDLTYDPQVLAPAGTVPGASSTTAGRLSVQVHGATSGASTVTPVSFKVVAKAAMKTEVGFNITGGSMPATAPPAQALEITAR
jgi:general secretion pathway protein D